MQPGRRAQTEDAYNGQTETLTTRSRSRRSPHTVVQATLPGSRWSAQRQETKGISPKEGGGVSSAQSRKEGRTEEGTAASPAGGEVREEDLPRQSGRTPPGPDEPQAGCPGQGRAGNHASSCHDSVHHSNAPCPTGHHSTACDTE